jgi:folate-binding protein YgfZ
MADALPTPSPACTPPAWAVITVTGRDAATFLQGQLTQDLRRLTSSSPLRAALCTPQGRIIALPWLVATPTAEGAEPEVLLVLPAELADVVVTTLRRYVLRARARLAVAPARAVSAWRGEAAALDRVLAPVEGVALAAIHRAVGCWLRLGPRRALAITATDAAAPSAPGEGVVPCDAGEFELESVRDGEPIVRGPTREHWVPQMLNLDALEGLSFTKGCYTGQEIVTRTQHRGQIKRRMLRFATSDGPLPAPGDDLLSGAAKAGEIVRAARAAAGIELLAVVPLERAADALVLGDGRGLQPLQLPYVLEPTAG